eukprot:TRINITY_DN7521_c0_g1_i1.p1 TRINITY_DN7521_c0_g1~~TRINITY_DN7521_c0_g1_i1.p1  ORF type:complete len:354 (+),score=109.58 TRINITY_DN7521_c0_g1_i1:105-1064(+)
MIKDGDRVLVCVSGGKDSLSLVHMLNWWKHNVGSRGVHFELGAITVDPQVYETFDPRPLVPYFESIGIPYFQIPQPIIEVAKSIEGLDSICSFCARMKRGVLYTHARKEGYNVLAMGHHLDDLAESFFMSVMHNGLMRTMKASYLNADEDLRIIRPFVFTRERTLRAFAMEAKLPVIPENCPACFSAPTERARTKQLLAQQEHLFPNVMNSIKRAIEPLMAKDRTGIESGAEEQNVYRSLKQKKRDRRKLREAEERRAEESAEDGDHSDREEGAADEFTSAPTSTSTSASTSTPTSSSSATSSTSSSSGGSSKVCLDCQ